MSDRILVTGGAGFIGSHLVDRLVAEGRRVRVLDSIEPQVHGSSQGHRNAGAEYVHGSILDRDLVDRSLDQVDAVVHLAAQVGVGQSMYEMARYVRDNSLGIAILLEALAVRRNELSTLVVASSMSIYGEGQYRCQLCGVDDTQVIRTAAALQLRRWEPVCIRCGSVAKPIPTREAKQLRSDSVYAVTKRDHEDLALIFGRSYGVRTIALRFFNVYGPRQSLSNPYTGVAAIFSSRLLNGQAPFVFEDGGQSRDFVHVTDVVRAIELALATNKVSDVAINIGTSVPTTVLEVAHLLRQELGVGSPPLVLHRYRKGDIRHCFADITSAREILGYEPRVPLRQGMKELALWIAETTPPARDRLDRSRGELEMHGLVV